MSTLSQQAAASAAATTHATLSENAHTVLAKRYLRKGPDGKPVETPDQMFRRVARAIAQPEAEHGSDAAATEEQFYELLSGLRFFPNSPTFTGAARRWGNWRPALCCRSRTTWAGAATASFRRCATRR